MNLKGSNVLYVVYLLVGGMTTTWVVNCYFRYRSWDGYIDNGSPATPASAVYTSSNTQGQLRMLKHINCALAGATWAVYT